MRAFARWLVSPDTTTRVSVSMMTKKASELARRRVHKTAVYTLRRREDFQRYCQELQASVTKLAREKLEADYVRYVEAHAWALDQAKEAGDYKAVAAFTVPVLDRVAPKREVTAPTNQLVVVNLSDSAAQKLTAILPPEDEIEVTEVEIVEPDAPV